MPKWAHDKQQVIDNGTEIKSPWQDVFGDSPASLARLLPKAGAYSCLYLFFKAWLAKLYSLRSSESGPWSSYHNAGELGHGERFGYSCSLPIDDTNRVDGILGGREGRGSELSQHDGPLDKLRSCKHGRRCWGNRNVVLGHRLGSNLWGKREQLSYHLKTLLKSCKSKTLPDLPHYMCETLFSTNIY